MNVKPVSTYTKDYELISEKIKYLDTCSEHYQGVTRPAHATCRGNFHNTRKLETNSKQKTNERDEKNSEDFDHALKKIGISFKATQKKKYRLLFLIR